MSLWELVAGAALGSLGTVGWGKYQLKQERNDVDANRQEDKFDRKAEKNEDREYQQRLTDRERANQAAEAAQAKLDVSIDALIAQLEVMSRELEDGMWSDSTFTAVHSRALDTFVLSKDLDNAINATVTSWGLGTNPVLYGLTVSPEQQSSMINFLYSAARDWKLQRMQGKPIAPRDINPFTYRPAEALEMSAGAVRVPDGLDFQRSPTNEHIQLTRQLTVVRPGGATREFGSRFSPMEWGALTGTKGQLGIFRLTDVQPLLVEVIPANDWEEWTS